MFSERKRKHLNTRDNCATDRIVNFCLVDSVGRRLMDLSLLQPEPKRLKRHHDSSSEIQVRRKANILNGSFSRNISSQKKSVHRLSTETKP